jgi:hypothetical protein
MKLPKKARKLLYFKHNDMWYQITEEGDKFYLYRCESEKDYTQLGSGNSPVKLEYKVYDGKLG